jgi:molybdopterin converting factor small subunit
MKVQVRLNAILRRYARADGKVEFSAELPASSTVEDLIVHLDIPTQEVGLAAVNLKYAEKSQALADGDEVILFPQLTGGSSPLPGQ